MAELEEMKESRMRYTREEVAKTITREVAGLISSHWDDNTLIQKLLSRILGGSIESLLEDYLNDELDLIAREFEKELGVKPEIDRVRISSSKMNPIIKELKEKLKNEAKS